MIDHPNKRNFVRLRKECLEDNWDNEKSRGIPLELWDKAEELCDRMYFANGSYYPFPSPGDASVFINWRRDPRELVIELRMVGNARVDERTETGAWLFYDEPIQCLGDVIVAKLNYWSDIDECDPPEACETDGCCWTHSNWVG